MLVIGSLVSLSVFMLIIKAPVISSGSGSTMTNGGEKGNKSKNPNQKDTSAKQMGICLVD
jgi:hypothetical protein